MNCVYFFIYIRYFCRYVKKIDSIHKFVERGIHWGAPEPEWAATIDTSNQNDREAMVKLFQVQQPAFLRNASFSRNYGIGIEQLHSGNYAFDEYIKADALEYLDV